MTFDSDRWLKKIFRRLVSIPEAKQRLVLMAEAISSIDPDDAAIAFANMLMLNIKSRTSESRLAIEAVIMALICGKWPDQHLARTREAAAAAEDQLPWIFLSKIQTPNLHEDAIIPTPDYSKGGRPLTLGERRSVAARPDRRLIDKAMRDPHPMVTAKLLNNPTLTEDDVVFMSTRRPAPASALTEIAIHHRWRKNRKVARALIYNPFLPLGLALSLLPGLDIKMIEEISMDVKFQKELKETATKLLSYRV